MRASRTRFALLLACIAGTLATAPCPAAAEARVLRLGHCPNITHAQALYARAGGQFEKAIGVPIEWTSFNAGPSAIEAMFSHAIDATFVGPNPAINGFMKSQGQEFVIVAGAASGGTGLVLRKDAGIHTDRDFGGKTIATPQLGNTQDVAARMWFAAHGYKLKEKGGNLALLALSNPDQLTLFQKKEIDGAWTVEPWVSRLELEGGGQLFLDEKTLWPGGKYVTTHLIVNREFLATNPQLVEKLLGALIDVTQQINADKPAAARILNAEIKKESGKALLPEVVERALGRVELTWDPLPVALRQSAASAHQVGFLREPPDLHGIYGLGILNKVLRARRLPPIAD